MMAQCQIWYLAARLRERLRSTSAPQLLGTRHGMFREGPAVFREFAWCNEFSMVSAASFPGDRNEFPGGGRKSFGNIRNEVSGWVSRESYVKLVVSQGNIRRNSARKRSRSFHWNRPKTFFCSTFREGYPTSQQVPISEGVTSSIAPTALGCCNSLFESSDTMSR